MLSSGSTPKCTAHSFPSNKKKRPKSKNITCLSDSCSHVFGSEVKHKKQGMELCNLHDKTLHIIIHLVVWNFNENDTILL